MGDAKHRQHNIAVDLYALLDACKPDVRDVLSNLLGWIGDASEVQRMEDAGELESLIWQYKTLEYDENAENDAAVDECNRNGASALRLYNQRKASLKQDTSEGPNVKLAFAVEKYIAKRPYKNFKTARELKHALEQFMKFAGDVANSKITAVQIHEFAEAVGKDKSKKLIQKKLGYVRRMVDHAVRKGWVFMTSMRAIAVHPPPSSINVCRFMRAIHRNPPFDLRRGICPKP